MKTVSGHQPCFLPWLGFFDRVLHSDEFVLHDLAQFETHGFMNRNRIKVGSSSQWLTVPVLTKAHVGRALTSVEIRNDVPWRRKHLETLRHAYGKAPFFDVYRPFFEDVYRREWKYLVDLNLHLLEFALDELGIVTPLRRASTLSGLSGEKSDFVLSMCRSLGATRYYSGAQGRSYLHTDDFLSSGIEITFQQYRTPQYSQVGSGFIPDLSVLDLLMSQGPAARSILRDCLPEPDSCR